MSKDPITHEIMRAEMHPDVYAGPNCEGLKPKWRCSCENDMGDNADLDGIALASTAFPPGTKVSVRVPVCPDCNLSADHAMIGNTIGPCRCGFDWVKWAEGRYS